MDYALSMWSYGLVLKWATSLHVRRCGKLEDGSLMSVDRIKGDFSPAWVRAVSFLAFSTLVVASHRVYVQIRKDFDCLSVAT